mgnify:CR=1 FL=1
MLFKSNQDEYAVNIHITAYTKGVKPEQVRSP